MSVTLGPYGYLNSYSTGTLTIPSNQHSIIASNTLFGDRNNLPVGTYAISCCEQNAGRFASCALVTVTGAPWSIEPSEQLTAFYLSPMAGQVVADGGQTSNTIAITASLLSNGQWIAIGNTTSSPVAVNYSIVRFV